MRKQLHTLTVFFLLLGTAVFGQNSPQFPERNCACTRLVGDAEVISTDDGQMHGSLTSGTAVRLAAIEEGWAKVYYNPGGDLRDCMLAETLLDSGWIKRESLPALAMLSRNYQPISANGTSMLRTEVKEGENHASFTVDFFMAGKAIWQAQLSVDHYEPAAFLLYYTGLKKFPWLFHFSGQMGDEQSDPGILILIGPKDTLQFRPDPGNRVTASPGNFDPLGWLTVKEAFLCQIPMITRWELTETGLERVSATFPNTVIPADPAELSNPEYVDVARLEQALEFYKNKDRKEKYSIAKGEVVSLELFEVDLKKGLAKVNINGKYGWIEVELLKSLPVLSSMFAGACGAG